MKPLRQTINTLGASVRMLVVTVDIQMPGAMQI